MGSSVQKRPEGGWSLRGIVAETFRAFRADRGLDLAGSLAFTTILTAVPLLASLSFFLVTLFRENDEQILAIVNAVLPYQTTRLTQSLRDFITESTAVSGVGLLLLAIASVRLVFVVEGVFNAVWGAPRRRARLKRILVYTFALVALGLILGGISWGLRAARGSADVNSLVNSPAMAALPFLLKALVLALLYRYLPNTRVRVPVAAVAGAAVALGLELLRGGFTLYVEAMLRMNLITGTLAFALMVILSLYFAWALIILGVELTHVLQTQAADAGGDWQREGRAEKAIRMMLLMSTVDPAPIKDLEHNPDAPPAETLAILEDLRRAGLVDGDAVTGFRLALSGREITVARIVDALAPGLYQVNHRRHDRVALVLEPLFYRLDSERRVVLNATLAELRKS